jgi:hypothetical protein
MKDTLGSSFQECVANNSNLVTACIEAEQRGHFRPTANPGSHAKQAASPSTDLFTRAIQLIEGSLDNAKIDPKFNFTNYSTLVEGAFDLATLNKGRLESLRTATNDGRQLSEMANLAIDRGQIDQALVITRIQKQLELASLGGPVNQALARAGSTPTRDR